MIRNHRRLLGAVSIAIAALSLTLSGCRSGPGQAKAAAPGGKHLKIIVVTHGQAGDPYWSVVKHGLDQAAADQGVTVSYQAPETYDISQMQKVLDGAIAQHPDGIALSIPDEDAIGPLVKKAIAAGIPVVSLDSGEEAAAKLGVLTHVGGSQRDFGKQAGARMAKEGVHHVLCLNHEQGNVSLEIRCSGVKAGLAASGGRLTQLAINGKDPTDSAQRIQAALGKDKSIDAMMALGPVGAGPMLKAAAAAHFTGKMATFDLSSDVLAALQAGKMDFAIDSQQYLMGYLPVLFLTQFNRYDLRPTQPITPTGPAFVTQANAAQVMKLSQQGLR